MKLEKIKSLKKEISLVIWKINKKKKIFLHEPYLDKVDNYLLKQCITSGFVSTAGSLIDKFENKIKQFTKSKNVVATIIGTSAIHVTLKALGVKENEEILMPSLNFVASAYAAKYSGCIPHFVDVNKRTLGIDPSKLRKYLKKICVKKNNFYFNKKTGRKIAAIIGVHLFGYSFNVEEIYKIAKKYRLFLIEDAAEAFGSYYKNKHLGNFGIAGILSFNGNKIITSGGGGAVLTKSNSLAKKIRILINNSKKNHPWKYDYSEIGYNYKMTNLNAALGYSQLLKIKKILNLKNKIHNIYKKKFDKSENIHLLESPEECKSNYWLNTLYLKNITEKERDKILELLNREGIQSRTAWNLLHRISFFSKCPRSDLKISEDLHSKIISIPSGPNLIRQWLKKNENSLCNLCQSWF